MNPLRKLKTFLSEKFDKLFTAVFATAGSIIFAQFPQFLTQYLQRLGGHIDEAVLASKKYNLPDLVERADEFKQGMYMLKNASEFFKMPLFIIQSEWMIAKETFNNFTPGMTFDRPGLYYLLAGMIFGLLFYSLIKYLWKKTLKSGLLKKTKKPVQPMAPPPPPPPPAGFQNTQY